MNEDLEPKIKIVLIGCSPSSLPGSLMSRISESTQGLDVIIFAKDEFPEEIIDIIHPNRVQKLIVSTVLDKPIQKQSTNHCPKFFGKVSNLYPKSKKRDNRFSTNKRRSR